MPKKPKGEPTQTTEKGAEIPVPKKDDVFDALRKVAKADEDDADQQD